MESKKMSARIKKPKLQKSTESIKLAVSNETTKNCKYCDKTFICPKELFHHEKEHKTSCDICNKKFTTISNLNHHKRIKHLDSKEYPCDFCGKRFPSKNNVLSHLSNDHVMLDKVFNVTNVTKDLLRRIA